MSLAACDVVFGLRGRIPDAGIDAACIPASADAGVSECATYEDVRPGFGWYRAHVCPQPVSYQQATSVCHEACGRLVTILDQAEHDFLARFRTEHNLWIGLERKLPGRCGCTTVTDTCERTTFRDIFEWIDGSALEYEAWDHCEPTNDDENFVIMLGSTAMFGPPGSWLDVPSVDTKATGFICEQP
jgi:hypothetical protein